MEFFWPLEQPLVMTVSPLLCIEPTIMAKGRSAGGQNSIMPSQIMLLLYFQLDCYLVAALNAQRKNLLAYEMKKIIDRHVKLSRSTVSSSLSICHLFGNNT